MQKIVDYLCCIILRLNDVVGYDSIIVNPYNLFLLN